MIAVLALGGFGCAEIGRRLPVIRNLGAAAIFATFVPSYRQVLIKGFLKIFVPLSVGSIVAGTVGTFIGIQAPVLLIHGRYDRMVAFEVSIAILNHIADWHPVLLNNCGHWPPFEKPAEWAPQVLAFLRGY